MQRWAPSISAYADWINGVNFERAAEWAHRLTAPTPAHVEGAIAEAVAWDWLVHRVDSMGAVNTSNQRSPDFVCRARSATFFVEVTNISREQMTEITKMQDSELFRGCYGSAADRLHHEILERAGKGRPLEAPFLMFVTTLHWNASYQMVDRLHVESVLHSPTRISGLIDERGEAVPGPIREVTSFGRAAFTRSGTTETARPFLSGVLFGAFGHYPVGHLDRRDRLVRGILHPVPNHPFDPSLLPDTSFCRFKTWPPSPEHPEVLLEWTDGKDSP